MTQLRFRHFTRSFIVKTLTLKGFLSIFVKCSLLHVFKHSSLPKFQPRLFETIYRGNNRGILLSFSVYISRGGLVNSV